MKKIVKIAITCIILVSICTMSVFAAPSVNELKNKKEQAEKEKNSLQSELTALMKDINSTEQKLVAKGEEVIKATKEFEKAKEDEVTQRNNMNRRIVVMYENGNSNFLSLLLESSNLAELFKRVDNIQAIHEYDRTELDKFVQTRSDLAEMKSKLESEQQELEKLQANLESQQRTLNKKINEKKTQIANFDAQIEEAMRQAAQSSGGSVVVGGSSSSGGRPYKGSGDPAVGQAIVASARSYIGVPYVWGGNGRSGIDCSGLTKAAHKSVGITLDRWSGHQAIGGKAVSLAQALPGDVICYSGHVGIYIGNNRMIHAPQPGQYVKEASIYIGKAITTIRRYW